MARYCVENWASRKSRCLVGATRTTRRCSVAVGGRRVRHRIVSLENPLDAGSLDVEDLGAGSVGRFGRQPARVRMEATWSGSRWPMSGTERHSTDDSALREGGRHRCGSEASGPAGSVAGVLIVLDLSEGHGVAAPSPTNSPASRWPSRATATWPEVVRQSGLGRLRADGAHVVVDPAALRALAGPAANEAWDEGFAGMCAYAAGKGWVEADGGVLAHIDTGRAGLRQPAGGR